MVYLSTSASVYVVNTSSHVVDRTKTAAKCKELKTDRAKRVKLSFFVVIYAKFTRSCSRGRASERASERLNIYKKILTLVAGN